MRAVQQHGAFLSASDELSDRQLYERGAATLVASWGAYASASAGARLVNGPGVIAAVFPQEPERAVYNNALLDRWLDRPARRAAIAEMESAYARANVERYAAWVHERDEAMVEDLVARGYRFDTSTRAMGMMLADIRVPRPVLDLAPAEWADHLRIAGAPADLLADIDADALHVVVARHEGRSVTTALAYDQEGDCGIFNVGTLPAARRRGLGTAVTALQLYRARDRGCTTASIQSTQMAEGLYARLGFRDLGRFVEYVPARAPRVSRTGS
jgi:ribosomal protein S18 acetylase RimI-like enzyme